MKVELKPHGKNLEFNNLTSDEMVREHWLPLLTEMGKEEWLKIPMRKSPLWPQF